MYLEKDLLFKWLAASCCVFFVEFEALSHWFEFLTTSPDLDLKVDLIIYLRTRPEKVPYLHLFILFVIGI
jgi:hypothetical protein